MVLLGFAAGGEGQPCWPRCPAVCDGRRPVRGRGGLAAATASVIRVKRSVPAQMRMPPSALTVTVRPAVPSRSMIGGGAQRAGLHACGGGHHPLRSAVTVQDGIDADALFGPCPAQAGGQLVGAGDQPAHRVRRIRPRPARNRASAGLIAGSRRPQRRPGPGSRRPRRSSTRPPRRAGRTPRPARLVCPGTGDAHDSSSPFFLTVCPARAAPGSLQFPPVRIPGAARGRPRRCGEVGDRRAARGLLAADPDGLGHRRRRRGGVPCGARRPPGRGPSTASSSAVTCPSSRPRRPLSGSRRCRAITVPAAVRRRASPG